MCQNAKVVDRAAELIGLAEKRDCSAGVEFVGEILEGLLVEDKIRVRGLEVLLEDVGDSLEKLCKFCETCFEYCESSEELNFIDDDIIYISAEQEAMKAVQTLMSQTQVGFFVHTDSTHKLSTAPSLVGIASNAVTFVFNTSKLPSEVFYTLLSSSEVEKVVFDLDLFRTSMHRFANCELVSFVSVGSSLDLDSLFSVKSAGMKNPAYLFSKITTSSKIKQVASLSQIIAKTTPSASNESICPDCYVLDAYIDSILPESTANKQKLVTFLRDRRQTLRSQGCSAGSRYYSSSLDLLNLLRTNLSAAQMSSVPYTCDRLKQDKNPYVNVLSLFVPKRSLFSFHRQASQTGGSITSFYSLQLKHPNTYQSVLEAHKSPFNMLRKEMEADRYDMEEKVLHLAGDLDFAQVEHQAPWTALVEVYRVSNANRRRNKLIKLQKKKKTSKPHGNQVQSNPEVNMNSLFEQLGWTQTHREPVSYTRYEQHNVMSSSVPRENMSVPGSRFLQMVSEDKLHSFSGFDEFRVPGYYQSPPLSPSPPSELNRDMLSSVGIGYNRLSQTMPDQYLAHLDQPPRRQSTRVGVLSHGTGSLFDDLETPSSLLDDEGGSWMPDSKSASLEEVNHFINTFDRNLFSPTREVARSSPSSHRSSLAFGRKPNFMDGSSLRMQQRNAFDFS